MTIINKRNHPAQMFGLLLALLATVATATGCELPPADEAMDPARPAIDPPKPEPPKPMTSPPAVAEYGFLYTAVNVAVARPWTFDGFVQQNSGQFDSRFQRCMSAKRDEAVRSQAELNRVCFAIYPPDPNATSCRAASDAASRVQLFDDMHSTLAGRSRFDATFTGSYTISLADAYGREAYASLIEQQLASPHVRHSLTCWF